MLAQGLHSPGVGSLNFLARPPVAIAYFVFAMAFIPLNDALIKLMSEELSIFQILAVRSVLGLVFVSFIPGIWSGLTELPLRTFVKLVIRGFCLVGAMFMFFLPLASLPLAEVTAIFFTAPLLITLLSVPILGEQLGIYRVTAVLIGMVGVLFIVKPGGEGFSTTYLLPMASAVFYASFQIITRFIREEASVPKMVVVQNLIYLFVGVMGVIFIALLQPQFDPASPTFSFLLRPFLWPDLEQLGYFCICAFAVLNLSFASTNAYSNVEATLASPFEYVALPMSVLWGIVFWGAWPDNLSWIGITLILSGGLFLIYRESVRNRQIASQAAMRSSVSNTREFGEQDNQM